MLDSALDLAAKGFFVFPVYAPKNGACTCYKGPDCKTKRGKSLGGKHPGMVKWQERASRNPDTIRKWWAGANANRNIGIALQKSGVVVVDIDTGEEGFNKLKALDSFVDAACSLSGSERGWHFYFRGDKPDTSKLIKGVDIPGYAVAPPSMHVCGKRYRWLKEPTSVDSLPPFPMELLKSDDDQRKALTRLGPVSQFGSKIPEGERNASLFSYACKLNVAGATAAQCYATLSAIRNLYCDVPDDIQGDELSRIVHSAYKYERSGWEPFVSAWLDKRLPGSALKYLSALKLDKNRGISNPSIPRVTNVSGLTWKQQHEARKLLSSLGLLEIIESGVQDQKAAKIALRLPDVQNDTYNYTEESIRELSSSSDSSGLEGPEIRNESIIGRRHPARGRASERLTISPRQPTHNIFVRWSERSTNSALIAA